MATEKLSEIVSTRFTPAEIAQLRDLAGGRPLSQVVRELAMSALRADPAVAKGAAHRPRLVTTQTTPGNRLVSVLASTGVTGRRAFTRATITG